MPFVIAAFGNEESKSGQLETRHKGGNHVAINE